MRFYVGKKTALITAVDDAEFKKQVLWGDWLDVENPDRDADKYFVSWQKWDDKEKRYVVEEFTIPKDDCSPSPVLEMLFIDVGQGDGCILTVPDGNAAKVIVIDAGVDDNMHKFLRWRRRNVDRIGRLHAAVITHPDKDHYAGFQAIFDDENFEFDHVYHNGLIERAGEDDKDNIGERRNGYCVEVYETADDAQQFLREETVRGRMLYPNLLWTALSQPERFGDVSMLGVASDAEEPRLLTGFSGSGPNSARIEILGPIVEHEDGEPRLREFGIVPGDGKFNKGKTKNGHSVLLKLTYGNLRIIFGGDLNRPSEDFLLRHYGGIGEADDLSDAVEAARERFSADVLKCCHHGSADVTDEFLECVSPFAYVVSSGDQESHVHPRPEVLGLLGKKGRIARPLILCTEILRSTPESLTFTKEEKEEIRALEGAVEEAADNPGELKKARKLERAFYDRRFRRLVNVYGAVNVRTNGERMVVAFLKESAEPSERWQTYEYVFDHGEWVGGEDKKNH